MQLLKDLQEKFLRDILSKEKSTSDVIHPERLELYINGYYLRIVNQMSLKFPVTKWALGENQFHTLVLQYIRSFPTKDYNLNNLGNHFYDHVQSLPYQRFPWLSDLVLCEANQMKCQDEKQITTVDMEQLQSTPLEEWENARFTFQPHMILQRTRWSIEKLKEGYDQQKPLHPSHIVEEENCLIFYQNEDAESFMSLIQPDEFQALDLLSKGNTLGEIIDVMDKTDIMESIFGWFRQWHGLGLITDITFDRHGS